MSLTITTYGDSSADTLLVQMADDHDLEVIEQEVSYIRDLSGGQTFCLKAVKIDSWNNDLSPWPAPAVFGKEGFGEGAADTLAYLLREVVPAPIVSAPAVSASEIPAPDRSEMPAKRVFLGGYSLAGLFALWAGYRTDVFDGIAAASPSIWFPSFTDYMRENEIHVEAVYLSLGDKEERTRNPIMSQVGNAIRQGYSILKESGTDCILEWNKGNHFREPDLRTAKAFAWLMNRD